MLGAKPSCDDTPDRTIVESVLVVAVMVLLAHTGRILRNCSTSQQTNLPQPQPLRDRQEGIDVSLCVFSPISSLPVSVYVGHDASFAYITRLVQFDT